MWSMVGRLGVSVVLWGVEEGVVCRESCLRR